MSLARARTNRSLQKGTTSAAEAALSNSAQPVNLSEFNRRYMQARYC